MTAPRDYYAVMEISRGATEKEIKTAYRRLARKYHPDVNKAPDSEEKFKELGQAYAVLSDPEKRAAYDQGGQPFAGQTDGFSPDYRAGAAGFSEQGFGVDEEWLASLFGHARQRSASMAGQDYHATLTLTLEEAFHGVTKPLEIPAQNAGAQPQILNVKIPAGMTEGDKIRLAGQGGAGVHQGPKGHLYLTIHLHRHPWYEVKGRDVYLTLPITPWEAALGATVSVPTLGGVVDLKIPPNSQSGQTLRLKGRGLPGKVVGDQRILLKMVTPPAKDDTCKAFYERMAKTMPFHPRTHLGV